EVPRGMAAMGPDVRTLLGQGAPAGCHTVASFHGQAGPEADSPLTTPVMLPVPVVRREPVPAPSGPAAGTGYRQEQ
ncbi:Nitrate reductase, partial [human gut metagenome]